MCYLVFGLSVNVSEGGVGVEGWMRVVPSHHTVTFDPEQLRGLSLRDRVHLTLQTCAQAVTWLCCTDLHYTTLAKLQTNQQAFIVTVFLN